MAVELNKTFIKGRMNKDLDERLIPDGEYIDAINVTIDTASGSNIGAVSNSLGNALVSNIQTLVEAQGVTYSGSNSKTIGAITYEADNLIYWLVTSDTFDAIFEYSEVFNFTSIVLLCTQGQLNFNKNYPVTGINFIPASKGEGPFLYWTDGLNPPRRINIARSKSYTTDDPRIVEDINVILRPPLYSPKIDLSFDTNIETSNNIQDKFIYFSYRFKYKDNQYSSLSPFSSVSFSSERYSYDYNTGDNKGMYNRYNKVDVTFDTGNEFVEQIQVLYFDTYRLNVYIIDNYNKDDLSLLDDSKYTITFSANKIYTPLESSEVTRLFDNVPLTAKAQEIIGNRLVYGNYVQFRDIVNSNGVKIIPDYNLELSPKGIILGYYGSKTFRSDRDYEIGIIYLDEYGRMTTALTSKTNTLYIPSNNSSTANSIKLTLNNEPPFWATNYRFAIKQAQGDYYNIFPRTFIIDGTFRYFLINESDRDKITVGGYIIFKTVANLATFSNKQFKVLELEYKQANSPFTIEGLYFKIKADDSDAFLNNSSANINIFQSIGRGPRTQNAICCIDDPDTPNALINKFSYVNTTPVYYSISGDTTLPLPSPAIYANQYVGNESQSDRRIAIKIASATQFQYTDNVDLSGWSASITIPSTPYTLTIADTTIVLNFDTNGTNPNIQYTIGDIFIFNVRGYNPIGFTGTPYNPINNYGLWYNDVIDIAPDLITGIISYGGHAVVNTYGPIYQGATIEIEIIEDGQPGSGDRNSFMSLTSTKYYQNFEEWFWKDGAYLSFTQWSDFTGGIDIGPETVIFREAINYENQTLTPPCSPPSSAFTTNVIEQNNLSTSRLYMLIRGFGEVGPGINMLSCERNQIELRISISQQYDNPSLSIETVPLESDVDVFYEMRKTYRIENGNHMVSWPYADFTYGALWPDVPAEFDNYIVLGPESTTVIEDTDMMHSFNVGERIYLRTTDTIPPIYGPLNGYYNILHIINDYAIIIDVDVSSVLSGQVIPGNVYYQSWEYDQDLNASPSPISLVVELNNVTSDNSDFNAFAFGNGVESYRIYDNYLRPTMKYSPRATSVIEDYKQEEKMASLCYSGIYKGDTSTNRLNSFNLSQANFKNLDKQYGPIQKLYAQDTNLMVLQQDKITSVLYGKNLLVDAVGGGQVASVPEVLGNQIVHPSEYGISNNPESFAKFSNMVFFTDSRRGAVLQMLGDQVIEISANGMRNYFRDELKDNPNTQKLGMYDPYNDTYVLSFTDVRQGLCELSISQDQRYLSWNTDGNSYFMFSIMSNTYWAISLQDSGYGTSWVDILIDSGYGDQDIYAYIDSNDSESLRNVDFVVQYCDGSTETFTLIQYGTELPPPPG